MGEFYLLKRAIEFFKTKLKTGTKVVQKKVSQKFIMVPF